MASINESYQQVISPITTSDASRPGGDQIAISFTKGKQSTQQQLDELAIAKAKDDAARAALVPLSADQTRYSWEAENQRLAEEAAARAVDEATRKAAADALALEASGVALKQSKAVNPLDIQSKTLALQEATALSPLTIQSAQQGIQSGALGLTSQQTANEAAAASLAQSKITNPLDVQSKQLGITGAQQSIDLAAKDQAAKDQAYKEAHIGMTPDQYNQTLAANAKYNAATKSLPTGTSGSSAQNAYNSLVAYKPYGQVSTEGYLFPTSGSSPVYVGSLAQRSQQAKPYTPVAPIIPGQVPKKTTTPGGIYL